jgi:Family of unknown function (DUF6263)
MKYFFKSLFVYLLPLILFYACKSGGGSGEAYTIKMSLNKGDKFSQNFDMKMNMNMEMAMLKDPVNMKMNMEAGCDFEVLDNNGTEKELKITYSNMKVNMDMGKIAGAGGADVNERMNELSEKLAGKSVTLKIDKANNVTSVSGFENLMISDSTDAATKATMEKMFSKEQFNSMFGMMFKMYPDKSVKVGDTWDSESEMEMSNIRMKVKMKHTLLEVKDGIAVIDIKGLIDGKGKMNQGGVSIDMNLSGGQNGKLTITMNNGYVKSGTYKMDVKGNMEVMGQKVAVNMTGDYRVKGK